ncbi:MAG: NAD(P)-dependent oxidoreductase [Planctomycetota bacterium]|nr:NAD(P)-dependent oxidoreductase [Planctomycetota bacterium]
MGFEYLITGGQGFFGAWIARRLLEEEASFVLTDLKPDDRVLRQVLGEEEIGSLNIRFGDISSGEFVQELVEEVQPSRIIHLAGLQVPTCKSDPVLGAKVNVTGTLNVFEAARRQEGGAGCVVYASSAAVAGPQEDYQHKIADNAAHSPRTQYGVFKLCNEGNARLYWEEHGLPSVGLRPLTVYGVGREVGITSGPTKAIRAALLGEEFTVPFSGVTGFNYIQDIADDFICASKRHEAGALALNTPGEIHDVREFLDVVEAEIPEAANRLHCEGGPVPVAWDCSESGLEALLGDVPHTSIEDGIRATIVEFEKLKARGLLSA